jgi:hypothetical protein
MVSGWGEGQGLKIVFRFILKRQYEVKCLTFNNFVVTHVRLLIKICLIGHFSFNTPCVSFLLADKTPSKIFRKCYHMYLITQQIRDRLIFWKVIDPADSLFIQNSVRDLLVCTSDVIFIKQSHSCLIIMFTSEISSFHFLSDSL